MFTKTKLAMLAVVALSAVAVAAQVQASPVGGSWCRFSTVYAGHCHEYTESFNAGETAVIELEGDGAADVDLYVYDEGGNLIAADTSLGDECHVSFTPKWTGEFTIEVVNRGSVYDNYTICML